MQRSEQPRFEQQQERAERRPPGRINRRRRGGDGTVTTGRDAGVTGGVTGAQAFSGPDLATVLAEVMDRLGSDAVILAATKVRGGGVGGFFAKERFEVLAAPAVGAPPVGAKAAALPWSLADDVAAMPAVPVAPEPSGTRPVPRRPAARAVPERLVASTGHVDALLALADAVSVGDRRPSSAAATGAAAGASPGDRSFGALLADAARRPDIIDLADQAVAPPAGGVPGPGRPTVTVARRRVPVLERPAPDRASSLRPAVPEVDRAPLPEIVVAHTRDGRRLARLRPAFTEVPRLTRAEARAATEAALAVRAPAPDVSAGGSARPAVHAAAPAVAPVVSGAAPTAPAVRPAPAPLPWVPEPSLALPGIVLLLGDEAALRAARRLAAAAGRDPADVVVAAPVRPIDVRAWTWVRDADEAARRQARWLARPEAVLVAVVVPADAAGVAYAAAVRDALDADHVRVVVSAPDACWTPLHRTAHAVDVA